MNKKNCWEVKNCGRQPGGHKIHELGICPATIAKEYDGMNHGKNAGRYCWAVAGTLCKGEVQGTFARKLGNCLACAFYLQVEKEEERFFILFADDYSI
jgi:hypothetical protein